PRSWEAARRATSEISRQFGGARSVHHRGLGDLGRRRRIGGLKTEGASRLIQAGSLPQMRQNDLMSNTAQERAENQAFFKELNVKWPPMGTRLIVCHLAPPRWRWPHRHRSY